MEKKDITPHAQADFARQVKRLRKEKGLSKKQLAVACRLPSCMPEDIENRQYLPGIRIMMRIAFFLGKKLDIVLSDLPEKKK